MKTLSQHINNIAVLDLQELNNIGSLLARCQTVIKADLNSLSMDKKNDNRAQHLANLINEIEDNIDEISKTSKALTPK